MHGAMARQPRRAPGYLETLSLQRHEAIDGICNARTEYFGRGRLWFPTVTLPRSPLLLPSPHEPQHSCPSNPGSRQNCWKRSSTRPATIPGPYAISRSRASRLYPGLESVSSAALSSGRCNSSRNPACSSTHVRGFFHSSRKSLSPFSFLTITPSPTSAFLMFSPSISSPDFQTCVHGQWRQKYCVLAGLHCRSTTLPSGATGYMVVTLTVWSYHVSGFVINRTSGDLFQHSPASIASPVTASSSIQANSSPSSRPPCPRTSDRYLFRL